MPRRCRNRLRRAAVVRPLRERSSAVDRRRGWRAGTRGNRGGGPRRCRRRQERCARAPRRRRFGRRNRRRRRRSDAGCGGRRGRSRRSSARVRMRSAAAELQRPRRLLPIGGRRHALPASRRPRRGVAVHAGRRAAVRSRSRLSAERRRDGVPATVLVDGPVPGRRHVPAACWLRRSRRGNLLVLIQRGSRRHDSTHAWKTATSAAAGAGGVNVNVTRHSPSMKK